METIKSWLSKEQCISSDEKAVILAELQNDPIGIRASNRFIITYSTLWNVRLINQILK